MSINQSNLENIISNPLNNASVKVPERPTWLCKHQDAKVVSYDPRKYICNKCNKNYILKVLKQSEILGALSANTK